MLIKIKALVFPILHRDSDLAGIARDGANKLLGHPPRPLIGGSVGPDERLRPA
jgi:hypothetical protein